MDTTQAIKQKIETITHDIEGLKTRLTDIHLLENEISELNFQLNFFSLNPNFKIFYEELLTYLECLYIGMAAVKSGLVQRTLQWSEILTRMGIQLLVTGTSVAAGPFGLIMNLSSPIVDSFVGNMFDKKSQYQLNHAFNEYINDISRVKKINRDIAYSFTFFYQEQIKRCFHPNGVRDLAIACGENFKRMIFKVNTNTYSRMNDYLTYSLHKKTQSNRYIFFLLGTYEAGHTPLNYDLPNLFEISYDKENRICSYKEFGIHKKHSFVINHDMWCFNYDKKFAILVSSKNTAEYYVACYVPLEEFSKIRAFGYYYKNSNLLFRIPKKNESAFRLGYVTFENEQIFNTYIAAHNQHDPNPMNIPLEPYSYQISNFNITAAGSVPSNLVDRLNKKSDFLTSCRNMNTLVELVEEQNKVIKQTHNLYSENKSSKSPNSDKDNKGHKFGLY